MKPFALIAFTLLLSLTFSPSCADEPTTEQVEFFEKKIRPIFADVCSKCHSRQAEKIKGGLVLDVRYDLLKGGETGPAIVPGNPDASLLVKAVRYKNEKLQMPPKEKLSDAQIGDLEAWVKMGAPDPRQETSGQTPFEKIMADGKTHWAFQPIQKPSLPKKSTAQNPIDAFVLTKLDANKLTPAPPADKRTLIRRTTIGLTGLPPTPEDVAAFLADPSPNAFEKVVDRLLASPAYGERWGRHWLDVARYADTKGYVGGNEESRYPFAYTYRDWVIRAFNEDLPYDKFLTQQIAADLTKLDGDNRPLAALGFLTLGRRFVNDANDIIDDRIDVVCRGTMALTVGCARCHDHKYDSIPTKDYYSLHGIFRSVDEPVEKPLLDKQPPHPEFAKYQEELKKAQNELNQYVTQNESTVLTALRTTVGGYLMTVHADKNLNDEQRDKLVRRDGKLNIAVHNRWKGKLAEWKKKHDPIFAPWFEFEALPDAEFVAKAKELAAKFAANTEADKPLNPLVAKLFAGDPPTELKQVAERYGKLFADTDKHWQSVLAYNSALKPDKDEKNPTPPPQTLSANEEALRQVLYAADAPANPPRDKFGEYYLYTDEIKNKIDEFKKKVGAVDVNHPGAPPRAMVMRDKEKPSTSRVHIRGNPGNAGPECPRQFLEILSGPERKPFPKESSGRLQLAQAIASPANPLTARVLVNRVWKLHFGRGIVEPPNNFGMRTPPPTHPELLDTLAAQFIEEGWSVKKLHRRILLSATYQQSSNPNPRNLARDPDNKFLWRFAPHRLDFEAMRDSMLAVGGKLDPKPGGKPVDLMAQPFTNRRTVYGFVDRQELPQIFRLFDFANPDTPAAVRGQTTVAQQALYLMNNPFVAECARGLVTRSDVMNLFDGDDRVRRIYQVLYQREPTPGELEAARSFVRGNPSREILNAEAAAWSYGYGKFDETTKRVSFSEFTHFANGTWQGGAVMPDPQAGKTRITADGGRPSGIAAKFAAIRRWTAPCDGRITIRGDLAHKGEPGDGVRGRIVSSRGTLLGEWIAHNKGEPTTVESAEIKAGDTIDFIVESREDENGDSFTWAPVIEIQEPQTRTVAQASPSGPEKDVTQSSSRKTTRKSTSTSAPPQRSLLPAISPRTWDAKRDFLDPTKLPSPLGAWEKYAQVLLLSNEFFYVE